MRLLSPSRHWSPPCQHGRYEAAPNAVAPVFAESDRLKRTSRRATALVAFTRAAGLSGWYFRREVLQQTDW
jgi:hypothetical protein